MPKRPRKHKVSAGLNGATKHPLGQVEKALLGKGIVRRFRPIAIKVPWLGVREIQQPFDKVQADLNREMYPYLFVDDKPHHKQIRS